MNKINENDNDNFLVPNQKLVAPVHTGDAV
jgi:hypothetical protein